MESSPHKKFRTMFSVFRGIRVHVFAVVIFSIGILVFGQVFAAAGVPQVINFQGRLLDSGANLLGGPSGTNYCFRFSLYDSATAGTKLWPASTPSTMTLPVRQGVFDANIGDTGAGGDTLNYNFQDNDSVYVNVEVAAQSAGSCSGVSFETLTPRQRIVSSGYAINSGTVGGFIPAQSASGNQLPALTSDALVLGGASAAVRATSTTALTIQGGGATGNVQFFGSSNTIDSSGNLTLAGGVTTTSMTIGSLSGILKATAGVVSSVATTGSGNVVLATSPTFVTPTLGDALATTINGNAITTGTGTLTLGSGKTFTASNTLTLAGTDGSTLNIGTGGTLGTNAYSSTAYAPLASPTFTGTVTIPSPFTLGATSVTSTGVQLNYLASATGTTGTTSSNLVFSASPTISGTPTFSGFSTSGGLLYTNASGVVAQTGAGTSTTILHGGATPSYSAVSLTADVSSTLPVANGGTGISSFGTGIATWLGTPSSANLAAAITDETGSGALVFGTSPSLTTPSFSSIVNTGTLTLPTATDTLVARATTDTLTNKTISGSSNTISNIANASLTNSTISGVALGGTLGTLTFGTYLTGTSYNGSAGVTIATNAVSTNTASTLVARDASGNFSAGTISAALSGNATTATALATGRTIAITGDLTYTSPSFDGSGNVTAAGTLATVNSNVGSFGSSTSIPTFTVNAKGLITAASGNAVIAPAGTLTGTTLASNVVTSSLTSVGTIATGVWQGTIIGATYGGTGVNNGSSTITLGGNLATSGAFATTLTATGTTTVTLPTTGTLYGTATGSISSAQLAASLSDETGSGASVFGTAPTITNPVITNINPGADFTLTQNSVAPFTSVNSGAVANTLYLSGGKVGIGITSLNAKLNIFHDDTYNNENLASLRFDSTGVDTTMLMGADPTQHIGYIQAFQSAVSYSTRALALQPNGGNVGIGTTTPGAILQVNGGASIGYSSSQAAPTNGLIVAGHLTLEGVTSTGATGTGNLVFGTSPTLVTPTLGVATATSINGNTFTAGTYTLTGTAGKTLTFSNSLTLAGTDGSTLNVGTGGTLGTNAFTSTAYLPVASPVFTTSITGPLYLGGTGVTSALNLQGTTANGTATAAAINFNVGNNGSILAGQFLNNGNFAINGNTTTQGTITTNASITAQVNMAAVSTDGISSQIRTSATVGTPVMYSPRLRLTGAAYNTTTTTSQLADFIQEVKPVSGNPITSSWVLSSQINAGGYTSLISVTNGGNVGIGTTTPAGLLSLAGNRSAAAWGTAGVNFQTVAATYTDTSTAASGTATNNMVNSFGIPTLAATNTLVTYTNAATVYIAGAPTAGTNATISNPYALDVATGTSIFGGQVLVNGNFTTSAGLTNANLFTLGSSITTALSTTGLLFNGASAISTRTFFNGTTSSTIGANNSYGGLVVGSQPVTTPASGTNGLLANMVVNPIGTVTSGGATVTATASLYIGGAGSGGTSNYAFYVGSGLSQFGNASVTTGTTVATFQNAGGTCSVVPSTSGGITCSSDMNLKKNITLLNGNTQWQFNNAITITADESILDKVLSLSPVNYNWNVENDTDPKHAGFIAQEVRQVFPDLVTEDPTTHLLSLNYTGMMPYTVEAIKEMNVTMQALPTFDDPTLAQNIATFLTGIAQRGEAVVNLVTAKKVDTQQLCLGDSGDQVCVTKDQLRALLQQNGQANVSGPSNPPTDNASSGSDQTSQDGSTSSPDVTPPSDNSTPPADSGTSPATDTSTQ